MDDVIENKFYQRTPRNDQNPYESDEFPASKYYNNNLPRTDNCYKDSTTLAQHQHTADATFLFWTLVVFIFILAVGNLILTFVILGVLRLGNGMDSIQLMSEHNLVKFFGNADLDVVQKLDGRLTGFVDVPVEMTGDGSPILMRISNVADKVSPTIVVGLESSYVQVDSFSIINPSTGVPIFSTSYPDFGLPKGVDTLNVKTAETKRIASPLDSKLLLKSDTFIKLKGAEGTKMDGKEVVWSADQDIFLKSVNKSIILSGHEGLYLDLKYIPIAKEGQRVSNTTHYKICVCMPNGRLFRVPVSGFGGGSCVLDHLPAAQHPCY